jgi:hypothetical protein
MKLKLKGKDKGNIHAGKIIGRLEEHVAKRGGSFGILMYNSDMSAGWLLMGRGAMLKGAPPIRYARTAAVASTLRSTLLNKPQPRSTYRNPPPSALPQMLWLKP